MLGWRRGHPGPAGVQSSAALTGLSPALASVSRREGQAHTHMVQIIQASEKQCLSPPCIWEPPP